jgi:hypothetical protein
VPCHKHSAVGSPQWASAHPRPRATRAPGRTALWAPIWPAEPGLLHSAHAQWHPARHVRVRTLPLSQLPLIAVAAGTSGSGGPAARATTQATAPPSVAACLPPAQPPPCCHGPAARSQPCAPQAATCPARAQALVPIQPARFGRRLGKSALVCSPARPAAGLAGGCAPGGCWLMTGLSRRVPFFAAMLFPSPPARAWRARYYNLGQSYPPFFSPRGCLPSTRWPRQLRNVVSTLF